MYYETISTDLGGVAIVWQNAEFGPRIRRIVLCGSTPVIASVVRWFPEAERHSEHKITDLGRQICSSLQGEAVGFDLGMMEMDICGDFQRKILKAEYRIPRGWVSTYGLLAEHAGSPGGGRAAGRALATNPFPIVIPCHRAVRSDGALGGYQGGSRMKRTLLEREGVEFDAKGRVKMSRVFYR